MTESEERAAFHNPWRESLENCISGDNYLRSQEYADLIGELDRLYAIEQAARASSPLEARLRDVKTNQEIDAMVREMKQPNYTPPRLGAIHTEASGKVELWPAQYRESLLQAHRQGFDAALHAEPVEKMKGEGA